MCGRTCLSLDPEQILCACKYNASQTKSDENDKIKEEKDRNAKDADNKSCENLTPEWRAEYNCGRIYKPSYNIAPTDITPVLISVDHFADNKSEETHKEGQQKRVVVPMMWGMIPFWHKGDYRKHGLTTNNCRLEHMLESKLYRGPFRRGQRCVVLCEGFYEWETTKSAKPSERAAYLIYVPQENHVQIYDRSTWSPTDVKLLKMAGLFDVWEDENGDKIYSYSIITFASTKIMSWMHYRMPAILETEQQINDWLDYKRVSDDVALATLRPANELKWHRVSKLVNNSRNKSDQCNKPIKLTEKPKMNKTMMSWLTVRKKREQQIDKQRIDKSSDDDDDDSDDDFRCYKRKNVDSDDDDGSSGKLQTLKRPCHQGIKKEEKNMQDESKSSLKSVVLVKDKETQEEESEKKS